VTDSFLSRINIADLQILRRSVRKVAVRNGMIKYVELLTDSECDKIIEAYGEETCQRLLQKAVDRKLHQVDLADL